MESLDSGLTLRSTMMRVRLLGGLYVENGGEAPTARPARLLLGWLAAFRGTHARGEVAARLWPDVLDESARASLRTALTASSACVPALSSRGDSPNARSPPEPPMAEATMDDAVPLCENRR